ncbi:Poly(A) polymerase central domain-containing protein [Pestalotiopsis sp. NC0098]|nr:Poly(A) polymerase central domain-containing protein [Pestalotiopsis sp. NC0098]
MASSERLFGVTPPIKTDLPTPAETKSTEALLEELKRQGTFESSEETGKRHKVLDDLQRITDEFVRRIAKRKEPHNTALIREARGEVFTYGSFCLGVYGPGSDIDTLVCAPRYVTREHYFEEFPGILVEMAPKGAITDLTPVQDAFVPIIKFEYWGISIDLIFSRIATLTQFPAHNQLRLTDNQYLRGLDDAELRSLNGTRVTNEILNLVPEKATFRLALRAIKLWAQRRAIYANIIGFPGGVVWAMLVARICQLYPKAAAAVIVARFFVIIGQWPWPAPVMLKHMEDGPLNVRVWNPKVYKGDGFHLMPVITPAYPQMCATFNITHSNKAVIQRELQRGKDIATEILAGVLPWQHLFVKHTFFTNGYKYYLAVIVTSKDKEAHKIWSGFVESKVRMLVSGVERHASIAIAHPFNKGFDRLHKAGSEEQLSAVIDGRLDYVCKEEDFEDKAASGGNIKNEPIENGVQPKAESAESLPAPIAAGVHIKPDPESEMQVGMAELPVKADPEGETKLNLADIPVKSDPESETKMDLNDLPVQSDKVFTTTHYIGLELSEGAKSLDLSFQVNEFKDLCYGWDKYKAGMNFLSIQHVRNFNLPDDVFEPGEVKPTRPLKKAGTANGAGAPKNIKRPNPSSSDGQPPAKRQQPTAAG